MRNNNKVTYVVILKKNQMANSQIHVASVS